MFLRKLAVVLTVTATFGVPALPSAHAAPVEEHCGRTVYDYGKVGLSACWRLYNNGERAQAGFHFQIVSPTTDTLWNDCFVDFQIRDQERLRRWVKKFDCKELAQQNRSAKVWDYVIFSGEPGKCYHVQAKWWGIYNNTAVGSHENARIESICTLTAWDSALTSAMLDLPPLEGVAIVEPEV